MTNTKINSLKVLWEKTLGVLPTDEQFAIWEELHTQETIRKAILKTAMKNQGMNGQMSPEHRLRFASKVMSTWTAQAVEHAKNRAALNQEFEEVRGAALVGTTTGVASLRRELDRDVDVNSEPEVRAALARNWEPMNREEGL